MIITIDGPIATGKSTIAKKLAREIGFIYFETGAMYRCLTYGILKRGINLEGSEALDEFLKTFTFEIKIKHGDRHYLVDNEDITLKIRGPEVTSAVSRISAIPAVREKLMALQREWAIGVNAVFEGRDMGTVVFPKAEVKVYVTGRPEIRAARRFTELREKFPEETKDLTIQKLQEEIEARDTFDSQRKMAPLKPAQDAFVIDTSDISIDEIILKILEYKDSLRTKFRKA
jgi:cytidylate kinase